MADNYSEATVSPYIPKKDVSLLELTLLKTMGYSVEEVDDNYYFYSSYMAMNTTEAMESLEHDNERDSLIDDDSELYKRVVVDEEGLEDSDIFQMILNKSSTLEYIAIEGCYRSTKMRMGEFGGYCCFIQTDRVSFMSTNDWLRETMKTAEIKK